MRISLTDLVDIVSKSGSPKATKVTQIKLRPDYQPATDFYKQFRDGIIGIHKAAGARTELAKIISKVNEKNRVANYPAAIAGYKKWWGTKSLEWFQPPSKIFSRSGVDVSINPELGLRINGEPYLIKLYLKGEKLSKARADLIVGLMDNALSDPHSPATMSVLDVRSSKLFVSSGSSAGFLPMVEAELAYVATLWASI
jgi:hypothetical protein